MNEELIEAEVNRRIQFKMSEFWDAFGNYMKRHEFHIWATVNKEDSMRAAYYVDAYNQIRDILRKEIGLPTALDGETVKRVWEKKEEMVDKLSHRLLDKGTRDYMDKKSFINKCVEDFIYNG